MNEFLVVFFLCSQPPLAYALHPRYDLQTKLILNEEHVAQQKLSIGAGEGALIDDEYQNQKIFIRIEAKALTKKKYPVELQFTVSQLDDIGNPVVISTPRRVLASASEETRINESEDLDRPKIDFLLRPDEEKPSP